jgi:hypothetical protein
MQTAIVRIDFDPETVHCAEGHSADELPMIRHRNVLLVLPTREHVVRLRDACERLLSLIDDEAEPDSQRPEPAEWALRAQRQMAISATFTSGSPIAIGDRLTNDERGRVVPVAGGESSSVVACEYAGGPDQSVRCSVLVPIVEGRSHLSPVAEGVASGY